MKKNKVKFIAATIALMIILNMFMPFSVLNKKVNAATVGASKPCITINRTSDIKTASNGSRYFTVEIAVIGDVIAKALDVQFEFDTTKFEIGKTTAKTTLGDAITLENGWALTTSTDDTTDGVIRIVLSTMNPKNSLVITQACKDTAEEEEKTYNTYGYDGYYGIGTFGIRILDDSIQSASDLTTDILKLKAYPGVSTGFQLIYATDDKDLTQTNNPMDIGYLKYDNFVKATAAVSGVELTTNPTTTSYHVGDTIDLTGGVLKVSYSDGTSEDLNLPADGVTVTTGSPATIGQTTVTVGYKGFTDTFEIAVTDPINHIAVTTNPTTTTYSQGDTISLAGGVVTSTTESGVDTTINLPHDSVTSDTTTADINSTNRVGDWTLDPTSHIPTATQKVTLTHEGKTANYNIKVNDIVEGISLAGQKTDYKYGQALNLQGTVTPTLTSGITTVNSNLSNTSVATVTGYTPTSLGAQTLTVNAYGKTKTFQATVSDYTNGINVTAPNKTVYKYGQELDLTGATCTTTKASGAAGSNVAITSAMISGYNENQIGSQTVTVTYATTDSLSGTSENLTDTFNVTVEDDITSIDITAPTKVSYKYGESLDVSTGTIVEHYGSGTSKNITMTSAMVLGFDSSSISTQELTITYKGTTKKYSVTVNDYVTGISITEPTKKTYSYNEELDLSGLTATKVMASGAAGSAITISQSMISGYDKTVRGSQVVTVTYPTTDTIDGTSKNFTKTFSVTVVDNVDHIVVTPPTNVTPAYNTELDLTGATVTEVHTSGNTEAAVPVTSAMISGYNKTQIGAQTVTVTYNGKTATFNVTVKDYVTGISITEPTKKTYSYNEELDLSGLTATKVMASGTTGSAITIAQSMISGYDKTVRGSQVVTVTYPTTDTIDGTSKNFTKTFNVTLVDDVDHIVITQPTNVQPLYNTELDLTGATVTEVRTSGNIEAAVPVTSAMISGYNKTQIGAQTVKVTYNGKIATFNITVKDYTASVAITTPSKTSYLHGESIDVTGGNIEITKASGAKENVALAASNFTESDGSAVVMSPASYDSTNKLQKTLKIKASSEGVDKTIDYPITIINDVKSIAMKTNPTKTQYNVNDTLDVTGGEITVTRAVGTSIVAITEEITSGFSSESEAAARPVTVSYEENGIIKTTTFNVKVIDSIISFVIKTTPKTAYNYGEQLDVDGGWLTLTSGSGNRDIPMTTAMVTGYNPTTIGEQVLTVTYGGLTKTYNVEVVDAITDIVLTAPSKTEYNYGEELDLSDATVKTVKGSGLPTEAVPVTSAMISGYNKNSAGNQTVTVTYEEFTKTFAVNVIDNISSIAMKTNPTKTTYNYAEPIDITGAKINVIRASGDTTVVDITNSMITGFDSSVLGSQSVTVTYMGNTTNFNVTVNDYVRDIKITTNPTKTSYKLNESLDVTGGKVEKIMASSATVTPVDMLNSMVTGFDSSTEGSKTFTVTYEGFTKTVPYTVTDAITGLTVQQPTKTTYKYGEDLDLTGATVKANKESGTSTTAVDVTSTMITGYNKNKLGDQTVTVTYEGVTSTFTVKVEDWDKELKISPLPKTQYQYGEELDVEDGKVAVRTASGAISDLMVDGKSIPMTASMVSGYDKTKTGTQTLTVSYAGFTTTYEVTVVDTVKTIAMLTNPTKTSYAYGEKLDINGVQIKITKLSGEYTVDVTEDMISGYDAKKSGEQSVTVTYGDFTTNFFVTVGNKPVVTYTPSNKTEKPTEVVPVEEPIKEPAEEPIEEPVVNQTEQKPTEQKTTETLGSQDKKEISKEEIILLAIVVVCMIIAISLLIALKRNNTEIYAIINGKAQYIGRGRINLDTRSIDIEKCVKDYDQNAIIRMIVKESAAIKLVGKDIDVMVGNETITCRVSKENNIYVINVK